MHNCAVDVVFLAAISLIPITYVIDLVKNVNVDKMDKWFEHTEYIDLRKIAEIKTGYKYTVSGNIGDDLIPVRLVSGIMDANVIFGEPESLGISYRELTKFQIKSGDIVFASRTSPNQAGKFAIVDSVDCAICPGNYIRIRAISSFDPYFLALLFTELRKSGEFRKMAKVTSNLASITVSQLGLLKVPDISLELQRQKVFEYVKQSSFIESE